MKHLKFVRRGMRLGGALPAWSQQWQRSQRYAPAQDVIRHTSSDTRCSVASPARHRVASRRRAEMLVSPLRTHSRRAFVEVDAGQYPLPDLALLHDERKEPRKRCPQRVGYYT